MLNSVLIPYTAILSLLARFIRNKTFSGIRNKSKEKGSNLKKKDQNSRKKLQNPRQRNKTRDIGTKLKKK